MFGQSLLSAFGSTACTTDTNQLFTTDVQTTSVATYQLNNATTSIPSNTYPGTANNITYAAGKFGNAAVFNGSNSYIQSTLNYSTLPTNNAWSVSCWLKIANTSQTSTAISLMNSSSGFGGWALFIEAGKIMLANNGSTPGASTGSFPVYSANTWVHVVLNYNGSGVINVYYNGNQAATVNGTISTSTNGNFRIGYAGVWSYFNGSVDQVRVFNSSLSQSDVTALYNETTTTAQSASVDYVLANPNSVAYYKMSDVTDQIGGNTLTNSNVNFNTEGKFGFAGAFNGSNSKLTISDSQFLPQGGSSRSISCWIKTTGGSNDGVIGYGNPANSQAFFIYITNQNKLGIYCYYDNTNGTIAISNNTWNHVVATYDGTNCKLYVNGVLDFTTAKTLSTGNGEFRIGGVNWNNSAEFFPGDIDQIRIYNSALSAENVTALYNEIECPAVAVTNAFNTVLYTGDATARSITTVGFKPDFTWTKSRNGGNYHQLFDSVRGATKAIESDTTFAESTEPTALTAFDTDGFSLGSSGNVNSSGITYVAWNWKAGSTAVSNTDGTITSQVSANVDAGFSIVSYTGGNNTEDTIGHGLDSAPELILFKSLSQTAQWEVYAEPIGANNYLTLNDSNAKAASIIRFRNTNPTNEVFKVGLALNGNSIPYIAYCFTSKPGFSKVGSYTGTGASGNVQYVGFEPSFIMAKAYTNSEDWFIIDNKRGNTKYLKPNTYAAEATAGAGINFLSNGFEFTGGSFNNSGMSFIYLAIA